MISTGKHPLIELIKKTKNEKESFIKKLNKEIGDSLINNLKNRYFDTYENISEDLILTGYESIFLPLDSCQK
ncbi:MAG: hypothetical protein A2430_00995 [Candidatus Liptonbacteria bacterium RIFOXYC1_FULL_36_8]|uniref:Uncharacterized protein n=3 Tax=Candidatus Liptoniibacteriota TaxID=1817909 RepID=A0A1G2CPR7_9BACT|nr:MAG: hypothetical protein A2390_02695 [Candidatus Liptonbacteria bacterium RIFOXYB1_FULL_36_10]OGZ02927.1 MAG: hypothetical protein A2430_00995 [Candidatus Liptonbacteria bacterium RIFOXYC1_FULL_36_8]OGZ04081.1 MAG: hypothetical protein A2604_02150 [Candidatus Liptonbacteria bacterium RIFOXYD1_FULL_36_11]